MNNAFTKVRQKKGAGGVDKMEVSERNQGNTA